MKNQMIIRVSSCLTELSVEGEYIDQLLSSFPEKEARKWLDQNVYSIESSYKISDEISNKEAWNWDLEKIDQHDMSEKKRIEEELIKKFPNAVIHFDKE